VVRHRICFNDEAEHRRSAGALGVAARRIEVLVWQRNFTAALA
jgi:hypothetical protein